MGSCFQKCLRNTIHRVVWRSSMIKCTKNRECQVWRGWSTARRRALRQHGGLNQSKHPLKATNFTAQIPWFFPVFNFRSRDYYSYCTCVWSVTNRWGLQWIKGDVFSGLTGWQWKRISSPLCGPMIRSWLIIVAIVVIIMCLRTAAESPAWVIHWKSLKESKQEKKRKRSEELRRRLGPAARLSFHLTDLNKWMINQCENWQLKVDNNFNNDGQIPQNELKLKIKLQLRWIQEHIPQ